MNIEIEKLTTWSAGREVRTQNGPRILRKGPLTAEYRAAWRANKEAMKAVGLSMGPVDRNDPQGEWEAIWWQPINGDVAKERDAAVEASRATDAAVEIPAPDGLAYMPFQKAGIAFALRVFGIDVSKAESQDIQGESSKREKDHRPECARLDSCESQTLNRKGCPSRSVGVLLADEMGL